MTTYIFPKGSNVDAILGSLRAPAPGTMSPWMRAMESQLEAYTTIMKIVNRDDPAAKAVVHEHGFYVDKILLGHAVPYMWSVETIQAVLSASQSIPLDAEFNAWNLNTSAVWWWFDQPLPWETLELPDIEKVGVRALCFGWVYQDEHRALGCSAWCDTFGRLGHGLDHLTITPSQTWMWNEHHTLGTMLDTARRRHQEQYGPGGKHHNVPIVGVEKFMAAADGLSRFILAGLVWLNSKVPNLTTSDGHIERHRRKDFNRKTGQDLRTVRIVNLRKLDRPKSEKTEPGEPVEWSCRWQVDAFWRNQMCGPGHTEKRLVYVSPHVKGPEDKPFRVPKTKIYRVSR
jgi:hypothetical protein